MEDFKKRLWAAKYESVDVEQEKFRSFKTGQALSIRIRIETKITGQVFW